MQTFQTPTFPQEYISEGKTQKIDKDTMNLLYNFSRNELKNDVYAFGGRHAEKIISEVENLVHRGELY